MKRLLNLRNKIDTNLDLDDLVSSIAAQPQGPSFGLSYDEFCKVLAAKGMEARSQVVLEIMAEGEE